jgi:hypothetical protein
MSARGSAVSYLTMMREVHRWYAAKVGNDLSALYATLLLMSVLGCANATSVAGLLDEIVHGKLVALTYAYAHKGILAMVAAALLALHIVLARVSGPDQRAQTDGRERFPPAAKLYIKFTAALYVLFIVVVILHRDG